MTIEFQVSKQADKFFQKHPDIEKTFTKNISLAYLKDNKNIDIKRLKTNIELYRMRIGKYRIVFSFDENTNELLIISVIFAASRGEIYNKIK